MSRLRTRDADLENADSGEARNTGATPGPKSDPDLARLVAAWPDLPPAVRAGILAMVASTKGGA